MKSILMNQPYILAFIFIFLLISCNKDNDNKILVVSPESTTVSRFEGNTVIILESNTNWQLTFDVDWISIEPANGNGNAEISISYQSNTETSDRVANITISGVDAESLIFSLVQEKRIPADKPKFSDAIYKPYGIDFPGAAIDFVDIDGDGDMDVFASNANVMVFYRNTGTPNDPKFSSPTSNPFGITLSAFGMEFVDIDDDGDMDLFASNGYGMFLYRNIGTKTNPKFTDALVKPYGIDIAAIAIDFADTDNDGDKAAICCGAYGTFIFKNTGTASQPKFTEAISHPFGVSIAGAIEFADIDDDGDLDVFTSNNNGAFMHRNTGSASYPNMSDAIVSPYGFSAHSIGIDFVDIDNDGDLDAFSTNNSGTFLYRNLNF
ncbi:MAG: hypothetical protein GQ527_09845 [Bacteroidales bacterium]|nr:hypothetical protein [Bacteroidales bacterium]